VNNPVICEHKDGVAVMRMTHPDNSVRGIRVLFEMASLKFSGLTEGDVGIAHFVDGSWGITFAIPEGTRYMPSEFEQVEQMHPTF